MPGKHTDDQYELMTKTPVARLVIRLGIPTTISMLVTNLYNLADTAFVGQLGTSASGAVGIVFGFMAILQAFGFMFGQGAGSIISRKLGQKDTETASRFASTAFFFSLGTGLVIALLSALWLEPLIYLLGSTDTILPYAKTYISCILAAAPFMTCSFALNNILRFEGKAALAMIGLLTGGVLNILLDPLFIFVFRLGILGAGLATGLSQTISFFILLSMFLRGKTQSKLALRRVSRNAGELMNIVATGFPSLLRQGLSSLSTVLLNGQAAFYGDAAVAGMSIVSRVTMFIFAVGLGIGQGFQPVCAFNFGAKKYRRVRTAYRFTILFAEGMLGTMAVVGLMLAPHAIAVFRDDPAVIAVGTRALQLQCCALFLQPFTVTTNMLLQSTGKRLSASITSSLKSGLYFIPLLLMLSTLRGLAGIQEAQPLADVLTFLTNIPFALYYFSHLPREDVPEQG